MIREIEKEIKQDKKSISNNEFDIDLITEHNELSKVFAFAICIQTGSRNEKLEINGISHLLEHLIFKRSNRKSAKQIANKFEELGALANAFTSKENIVFYVRGLNENIKPIMNLMFEIVYNAKFILKEVEKEKLIILDEINSYDDDAEESIYEIGEKLIFDSNPLSYTITGNKKSLSNIDLNSLNEYYNNNFNLSNSKFTFIGNFDENTIKKLIFTLFSKNSINQKESLPIETSKITEMELKILNKTIIKDFSQSHLLYLLPLINLNEEEKIILNLLNLLFGESMSSRLYYRFRESNALSYSVYSSIQAYSECIVFYIYLSLDKTKLKKANEILEKEINKLINGSIEKKELKRSKEQLKTSIYVDNESLTERLINLLKLNKNNLNEFSYENFISKLNKIDTNMINEFCRTKLNLDKFSKITYKEKS